MNRLLPAGVVLAVAFLGLVQAAPEAKSSKEGLQACQDLIGSWRCTGEPSGTREQKLKGFWQEKVAWQWQFKANDVLLVGTVDKGKYFRSFELRYLTARKVYQLKVSTPDKETLVFEGPLEKKRLTLERTDSKTRQTQRLVFSLLHSNRYLTRYEVRAADHTSFASLYQLGCTKEGVAFASGDDEPECIVSGGLGTMPVSYKGKTYYVCCSGCRDAFKEDPEKYIREAEANKKKKE